MRNCADCNEPLPDDADDCPKCEEQGAVPAGLGTAPLPEPARDLESGAEKDKLPVADEAAREAAQQDAEYATYVEQLEAMEDAQRGPAILIVGHRNAGKSFCIEQAKKISRSKGYIAGDFATLLKESIYSGGALTTKEVQETAFALSKNAVGRNWTFIDVPGEFFDEVVRDGRKGFAQTDDIRVRKLAAAVSIASGVIVVFPGPATFGVRERMAPEMVGDAAELLRYEDSDWYEQNEAVEQTLNILGPLGKFLHAIETLAKEQGSRTAAFEHFRSLTERQRQRQLAAPGGSDAPLFAMITKSDQIFGPEVPPGEWPGATEAADWRNPWLALLRANEGHATRKFYHVMRVNFSSINLDFSAACAGGAVQVSKTVAKLVDGQSKIEEEVQKRIPADQLGKDHGIWAPIEWLLDRIAENEARQGWLAEQAALGWWKRARQRLTPSGLAAAVRNHDRSKKSPFDHLRDIDPEFKRLTD